jgi:hypothetical protein
LIVERGAIWRDGGGIARLGTAIAITSTGLEAAEVRDDA